MTDANGAARTWAIVVAAGSGTRFGGAKQFELLGPSTVLERSVTTASAATDGVTVVASDPSDGRYTSLAVNRLVSGGATRSESVREGLATVPDSVEVVVVHDAARPLASLGLFQAVVNAIESGAAAAIPGVPVTDTIKRVTITNAVVHVAETLDRSQLVAVQTPQAFSLSSLRRAHALGTDATDDAALIEAIGESVVVVPGEPANIKITVPSDLAAMRAAGGK